MPRVSRAEAERNRGAIENASSRLFRERGLKVSLDDVMAAAGLTHGGFYGHFESKDELASVACASAFREAVERWHGRVGATCDRTAAHAALIGKYLTPQNRDSAGTGCPLAALATDVAREREDKPVRRRFREGLEMLVEILTRAQPVRARRPRERALAELSTLVGAMILARATGGSALSDDIMSAARQSLLGSRSGGRGRMGNDEPPKSGEVAAAAGTNR
jgi:TetR/AcrR family transcriptional repressor of nem operon